MSQRRFRWECFAMLLATMALAVGCAARPVAVTALDEVERVRVTPSVQEGARRAPAVVARAEHERDLARRAHASGDDVAAVLHAEQAIAAYSHALSVARLAIAVSDLADAQKSLEAATGQQEALETSRAKLELDAQELERRVQDARERLLVTQAAGASEAIERTMLTTARSLALEARLICGAARLVTTDAEAIAGAEAELATLTGDLARPWPPVTRDRERALVARVDEAGTTRMHCLNVLTRARRVSQDGETRTDALLAELSASGGWDPTRDERGVVVTLRNGFQGTKLTGDAQAKLESLGRVAGSHPGFGVQVVVHDADVHAPGDDSDAQRADAVVKALVAGGAASSRMKAELVGTAAPVVDPSDAHLRTRNERVDVVFVTGVASAS